MTGSATQAAAIAAPYSLASSPNVLAIGTFDDRVTVLSQQRRALNLVWALIEAGRLPTRVDEKPMRVAVVGAGFAGLTFAAALLQKRCRCAITILEERDTLLPLQQGSDTRWLHPHIYDWPAHGSNATSAMLPVLNWTAARASDVVVQVVTAWEDIAKTPPEGASIELYCNTRHLQLRDSDSSKAPLEWVGERRDFSTGRSLAASGGAKGTSADFDLIVLAVGFGLETDNPASYWRNEVLAQPILGQQRTTYLVSGQGDGAMIDLLRLKISQFRQDRILAELFTGKDELLQELRSLRSDFLEPSAGFSLFLRFDALCRKTDNVGEQMKAAMDELGKRLRRDAEVVLKLKPEVRNLADLLRAGKFRASFQNALLVYLLYRCGGFAPAAQEEPIVAARFGIPDINVIRRHGTDRLELLGRLLPPPLYKPIAAAWSKNRGAAYRQSAEIEWSGGYFGTPGREEDFDTLSDEERAIWRKEYLPGPTSLLASAIAGAASGLLASMRPTATHFRVTLHRMLPLHDESLLQQACDYVGRNLGDPPSTAGRTYPVVNATIGLAYRTRRIVRSVPGINPDKLNEAMGRLHLNQASRQMAKDVRFVAAIPILQPEDDFFEPSPVCGVLYFDSRDEAFDLTDRELGDLKTVLEQTIESVRRRTAAPLDRIENTPLSRRGKSAPVAEPLPADVSNALLLPAIDSPRTAAAFLLNHDDSDLTPVAG